MTAKVTAFILTFVVNVIVGVAVFFFMLLAMNGFSESDANYGLGTYIVLAVLVSITMSVAAAFMTHSLVRRSYRASSAALISIPIFSAVGAGLKVASCIIGLLVADYVRREW